MVLTELFDRIVIINLPERADRRRQIAGEISRLGLSLETPGIELFRAIRPSEAGGFPSCGARGAYLSHLGVLCQARADGIERLLVMEDDLVISPQLRDALPELTHRLAETRWDLLYLGHLGECHKPCAGLRLVATCEAQQCLHFYAIHARQFTPLIDYLVACLARPAGHPEGGAMHVDGAFSMFRARQRDCHTLLAEPSMGWQRPSRSDITANRWYDRNLLLRGLIGLVRRCKGSWLRSGMQTR